MPKSILYLTYDGLTDPLGQSQILPYLKGLCGADYQFHVISFEKVEQFKSNKREIEQSIEALNIKWHPQVYHKRPPIISTIMDLTRMLKISSHLMQGHDIHMVHARSYPPGLVGLWLKRRFKFKFLFDIRGFWADERVEGGLWKLSNPIFKLIYNYLKRMEIEMMNRADHIISLSHAGKGEIVSGNLFKGKATGIEVEKITVIPCAVDLDLFDPEKVVEQDRQELLAKLGLEEAEQILVYLGSLGTWYMLDEMLLYFKKYLTLHPNSKFLFVTKDDPEVVLKACKKNDISKESVAITSVQRIEVPLHLSIATLGVFFIRPTYSKKASSATKMGEMLMSKLPVVTNLGVGDVEWIAKRSTFAFIITDFKSYETKSITEFAEDEYLEKEYFSLESGIKKYMTIYNKMFVV